MTAFAHLSGGFGSLPAPEGLCPPLYRTKRLAAALGGQRPESPPLLQLRVHYARKAARRFTSSQVDAGPLVFCVRTEK